MTIRKNVIVEVEIDTEYIKLSDLDMKDDEIEDLFYNLPISKQTDIVCRTFQDYSHNVITELFKRIIYAVDLDTAKRIRENLNNEYV